MVLGGLDMAHEDKLDGAPSAFTEVAGTVLFWAIVAAIALPILGILFQ